MLLINFDNCLAVCVISQTTALFTVFVYRLFRRLDDNQNRKLRSTYSSGVVFVDGQQRSLARPSAS